MNINIDRLRKNLEELGAIGRDNDGGISRPSFSRADLEARAWLIEKMAAAGLAVREDGAGNIFGRLEGAEGRKTVMAGSHIDTVLHGGAFDGSVGVLAALECLERIREEGYRLAKPLEAAAFTDEEGNLVGDFLGSRAFIGALDREALESGKTALGASFAEILKHTPFTVDSILGAHKEAPELDSYLELHIEQGPVLDDEGLAVGIVDTISGKHYRWCSFLGEPGHAGTVPIELRRDAFLGLADFALRATRHVAVNHYGSFVTIGRVLVHPGAFSIVPGRVDFSFEFRSRSAETLAALERELFPLAEDVAATRGLSFLSKVVDATTPVAVPDRLKDVLTGECDKLGYGRMFLPSGAGHDAQILAAKTETAMIFIPSPDGASHCPEETVRWEDLEAGANVLLNALLRLAG